MTYSRRTLIEPSEDPERIIRKNHRQQQQQQQMQNQPPTVGNLLP